MDTINLNQQCSTIDTELQSIELYERYYRDIQCVSDTIVDDTPILFIHPTTIKRIAYLVLMLMIMMISTPSCIEEGDIIIVIPIDSMDHIHCTDTVIDEDLTITFVP